MRVVRGRWLGVLAAACGLAAALIVHALPAPLPRKQLTQRAPGAQPANAPEPASLIERPPAISPVLEVPAPSAQPQASLNASAARAAPPALVVAAPSTVQAAPSAFLALGSVPPAASAVAPARTLRRVPFAALATWLKPGLCSESGDATATRDKLSEGFRVLDGGERGQLHLDPRLPEGAEGAILGLLEQARSITIRGLGASPPPPQVYVYFDEQLLKAAACINENVVAFYDGALHLVAGRADLPASVVHEYTHHALFSSGLMGPAWAQEGMAMSAAGEIWWRSPERIQALLQLPFSADQMDRTIPYKLPSQQAVSFYVQSALTVECLKKRRAWSLGQLADALRAGNASDSLSYDLPELAQRSFLSDCVALLARR